MTKTSLKFRMSPVYLRLRNFRRKKLLKPIPKRAKQEENQWKKPLTESRDQKKHFLFSQSCSILYSEVDNFFLVGFHQTNFFVTAKLSNWEFEMQIWNLHVFANTHPSIWFHQFHVIHLEPSVQSEAIYSIGSHLCHLIPSNPSDGILADTL